MFSVIWAQGCMTVENPLITYGSTKADTDIPATLARDVHNGMLANYVPASPLFSSPD